MNLNQAVDFATLRTPPQREVKREIKSDENVAEFVFAMAEEKQQPFLYMVPDDWRKKWLKSKKFVLMNMPITCAALPTQPKDQEWVLTRIHAKADHPIVVDVNKNKIGKASTGFIPQVIVLDGKHRFKAASLRGESHILAWVGEEAVALIEAQIGKKNVKAGGPGSGRHPTGVQHVRLLLNKGFRYRGVEDGFHRMSGRTKDRYSEGKSEHHNFWISEKNGAWAHERSSTSEGLVHGRGSGKDFGSLKDYVSSGKHETGQSMSKAGSLLFI
jgi:hypothetical protein